jgi:hypothetical protein
VSCSPVWLRVSAALLLQAHGRVPEQQRPQQAPPVAGGPGELRGNEIEIPHCGHDSEANTLPETGAFATILLRPEALPEDVSCILTWCHDIPRSLGRLVRLSVSGSGLFPLSAVWRPLHWSAR